jgi:hypothetical protein
MANKYKFDKKFDSATFNRDFLKVLDEQEKVAKSIEQKKLNEINDYYKNKDIKKNEAIILDKTINTILNEWFKHLNDIYIEFIKSNKSIKSLKQIVLKKDRLFYIGLTLIFIGIVTYLIYNI